MIASTVDPSNEENWSVVAGGAVDVIVTAMDEEKNQSTECNIPGRFSSQRNRIQSSPNTFTHERSPGDKDTNYNMYCGEGRSVLSSRTKNKLAKPTRSKRK
jgi:hypothetical protein